MINLYISPSGNDKNPGTLAKPFKTIQKCASSAKFGQICNVRAGNYPETISPNDGITIQGYGNEKATIDGRNVVSGFQPYKANQYVANVALRSDDTNQIFVGETAGTEAKWPNGNDLFHPNWERLGAGTTDSILFDTSLPSFSGGGAIKFWSGDDAWVGQSASIVDSQAGSVKFTLDASHGDNWITPKAGGLYYLYGNLAFLDSDYEWFYDSKAQKLYLQLPAGKSINSVVVKAKTRDVGIDLSGKINVTIKNLAFIGNTIKSDKTSAYNLIDGINAQYISQYSRLTTDPLNASWVGGFDYVHNFDSGIMLKGHDNTLRNSVIDKSACNGVLVTGDNNQVINNLISNVDYLFNSCAGIFVVGDGHQIQYNTVFNVGRSAIFPTRLWHSVDNPGGSSPTHVDISYNNLFNIGLIGNDIGAIYMGGGVDKGTRIHHNWIYDAHFPNPIPTSPIPHNTASGVYLDNNTSQVEVYQNVLWALDQFPIFINGNTSDATAAPNNNNIHNNSIPDRGTNATIGELGPITYCGTTSITDNKIYSPIVLITPPVCATGNNSPLSAGANEMEKVVPGCTMESCKAYRPKVPVISTQ